MSCSFVGKTQSDKVFQNFLRASQLHSLLAGFAVPRLPTPVISGKPPNLCVYNENPMSTDELQITDIRPGTGKAVVKGALITTQYTGTLEDGTVFDSSWERGKPFQCVIGTGRVIKGWDQGLMGMQVGGVRTLFVPAHLAYGERSMGAHIKPNSNLRFEIELLEVLTRDD
jgi:peptidylprolyl isomerase